MIGCHQIANMHLATIEHQIVSKSLAIQDRQVKSVDSAIKEVHTASNQNDACPRHLAMLVTSC